MLHNWVLGRVAELAHVLGRMPSFELLEDAAQAGRAFEPSGDGQQERHMRRDGHSSRK